MPGGAPVALVLFVALLAIVLYGARPAASARHRWTLLFLRMASALAIFLLATQPALWGERVKRSPGVRAVLLDVSQSMGVRMEGSSRAERARALATRWLKTSAGQEARFYALGEDLRPLLPSEVERGETPRALASSIFQSVTELSESSPELGAIIVVSDGADTSGKAPPSGLPVKVHAVAVSDPREMRDDAIAQMHEDAVAFLHGEARVQAKIRSMGFGERVVAVSLLREGQVVASREVSIGSSGEANVELTFKPNALGREVYSLEVALDPEDDVPENNKRAFLLRVKRERLRVLHVSGRPSWDQRFLRGFLKRDPSIDLVSFFILRSVHDLTMSDPSELALIPFPTDELFRLHLTSFDCVILQDFDYAPYQMAPYLPLIRDYVLKGGGLAMIGGTLSFDGGGYSETPLADVLPVRLEPSNPAGAKIIEGTFSPVPVAALMHHPILEIEPEEGAAALAWKSLAPLDGANALLEVRNDSVALLEHPTQQVLGKKMPVLAVGSFDKGRSLALGADTSWHWSMPTAGRGGDPAAYDRFWDRAVRWLTRDPLLEPARIETAKPSVPPKAALDVSGLARDHTYRALAETEVEVLQRVFKGSELMRKPVKTDYAGAFTVSLPGPAEPGAYEVVLMHAGKELASSPLLVELGSAELYDPRARPDALETLAKKSRGRFSASPDSAPDLADLDATRTESLGIERRAPFSEPLWVALLLSVLCLEWWLRRRLGEA